MAEASLALTAPVRGRNIPPSPAYPSGTRIYATCDLYEVMGELVGHHEDLDDIVRVYDEAEGETVHLKGRLWSIEVLGEVSYA